MLMLRVFRHNRQYSIFTRNSQQNVNILNLDKVPSENERKNKNVLKLGLEKGSKQKKKSIQWSAGSVALLVVPAIAFSLGCWQVYRLQWKLKLIDSLESRLSEKAIDFPIHNLSVVDKLEYQRVRIKGEFIHDREFVITPRGRFDKGHSQKDAGSLLSQNDLSSHGGHVITPFKLYGTDMIIMVNRGWVPAHKITRKSRIYDEPRGMVSFEAIVRKSEKRPQFVGRNIPEQGVWFYKDFEQMARQCGAAPVYVEAVYESTLPNGPIGGQTNISIRNEHLSYLLTWKAKLSLSSYSMAVISDYLVSETMDSELSKRELVRSALHNMIEVLPEDDTTFIESVFTFLWPWIVMCNMAVLPPAIFFVLRSIMTTRSFWLSVLTVIIFLSMITTYNRMYQEKIAARLAAATEMKGDACAPAGLIEQGLDFLSGLVTLRKKSSCLKFIESQTVSIVSEISLLDVFSDVLSNGLFGWLSTLGPHLNKFYRGLCEGIPLPYLILVFTSMILLFVRISTPVFTIEPLMITLLGNVCSTVVHGLTSSEHAPIHSVALPSKDHPAPIKGTTETFHNVTQRTPERIRRLQERKRREKLTLKPREESESDGASMESSNESKRRDRSINRGRDDF